MKLRSLIEGKRKKQNQMGQHTRPLIQKYQPLDSTKNTILVVIIIIISTYFLFFLLFQVTVVFMFFKPKLINRVLCFSYRN